MAEIQRGAAVVWGISTTGYTFTGIVLAAANWLGQSQEGGREADSEETRDAAGEVINRTTYNQRQTLSITVIPSAATLGLAKSNTPTTTASTTGSNYLPTPGMEFFVIDTDTHVGATGAGKSYEVQSASFSKTNTGKETFTVVLGRWAGISSYAQIAS